jgi:hypothetical protein
MKKFKIRCSAIGHIMTSGGQITEKQLQTIADLQAKEKRTARQEETLIDLIDKRDNPELPEGAKTYCKDWFKGQLFDYVSMMRTKYTDKGNIMEDEAIDFVADQLGYGFLMKNEEHFSDEYMQGTPDVILKNEIIDVKNSWDASTFPLFDEDINPAYYWQLQGYMHLTGKCNAKLIYCLMDTPEHLIEKEARWYSISQGFEELEMSIFEKFKRNLTYENVPGKLKVKVYEIERSDSDIQKIKDRVVMCRTYINELQNKIK